MLYHILFMYLSAGSHFGRFHLLVIMKSGAVNTREQVFAGHAFISLAYGPRNGVAGSHGNSVFNLLRN